MEKMEIRCDWCDRRIIKRDGYAVTIDKFMSFCCCKKHLVQSVGAGITEEEANQIIFDLWDTPNYNPAFNCINKLIHFDDGKSSATSNLQFERAKKILVKEARKDPKLATAITELYMDVLEPMDEDEKDDEDFEEEDEATDFESFIYNNREELYGEEEG